MRPLFSVIIPVRDDPSLEVAVRSALGQTITDIEVIVVDDGSDPKVALGFDDSRVIVMRHDEPLGPGAARNSGVQRATGRYLAFLDSDDRFRAKRLEAAASAHRNGEVVVVSSRLSRRASTAVPNFEVLRRPQELMEQTTPHLGMTSIDRRAFKPFDEAYLACQDVEWWIRIVESGVRIVAVNDYQWVWGRSRRVRVLNGPLARLAFSYQLMADHCAFFRTNRKAKAFRLRRIAAMERLEGNFAVALGVLGQSARSHLGLRTVGEALRIGRDTVLWDLQSRPLDQIGTTALPPIPPGRAKQWRPLRRGSLEARMRAAPRLVGFPSHISAPRPRPIRGRVQRLGTLIDGSDHEDIETAWGYLRVSPNDMRTIAPVCFEPLESAILARLIDPGQVVVDIGANIGWYTNLFAQRVGPTGRVIAVEPIGRLADRITAQAQMNETSGWVTVIEGAVSRSCETLAFIEEAPSQLSHVRGDRETIGAGRLTAVEGISFPELAERVNCEIDLVKIDVEGQEPVVLESLLDWVNNGARPPIIFFEANGANYQRYGFSVPSTIDRLRSHYEIAEVAYSVGGLSQLERDATPVARNMIAVPCGTLADALHRVHGRLVAGYQVM